MKKLTLAVLLGLMTANAMAMGVGSIVPGSESTVSADLTFSAQSAIKASLTPASNLTAGNIEDKTVVATLTGDSSSGNGWVFGLLPDTATQNSDYIVLTGAQDNSHKLVIMPDPSNKNVIGLASKDGKDPSYVALADNTSIDFVTKGAQNVAADSYKLTLVVAAYQP